MAWIIDVLTDVERRADEVNRRAAELVEGLAVVRGEQAAALRQTVK